MKHRRLRHLSFLPHFLLLFLLHTVFLSLVKSHPHPRLSIHSSSNQRQLASKCIVQSLELYDAISDRPVALIPSNKSQVCIDGLSRVAIRAYAPKDCIITFFWRGGSIGWDNTAPYFSNLDRDGDVFGMPVSTIEGDGYLCADPLIGKRRCANVTFVHCKKEDEYPGGHITFEMKALPTGLVTVLRPGRSVCIDDFNRGNYTILAEPDVKVKQIAFKTNQWSFTDTAKPYAIAGDSSGENFIPWDFKPKQETTIEVRATATRPDGKTFTRSASVIYKCNKKPSDDTPEGSPEQTSEAKPAQTMAQSEEPSPLPSPLPSPSLEHTPLAKPSGKPTQSTEPSPSPSPSPSLSLSPALPPSPSPSSEQTPQAKPSEKPIQSTKLSPSPEQTLQVKSSEEPTEPTEVSTSPEQTAQTKLSEKPTKSVESLPSPEQVPQAAPSGEATKSIDPSPLPDQTPQTEPSKEPAKSIKPSPSPSPSQAQASPMKPSEELTEPVEALPSPSETDKESLELAPSTELNPPALSATPEPSQSATPAPSTVFASVPVLPERDPEQSITPSVIPQQGQDLDPAVTTSLLIPGASTSTVQVSPDAGDSQFDDDNLF